MPADEPVIVEVDEDGIALLSYNRPEQRNTWSVELEAAFHEHLVRLDADKDVRAVVVTGRGKTFCPGSDASALAEMAHRTMDLTGRISPSRMWAFRKPLIAAINGACAGVGLVQALMCDVRFAAPGVRFTTAYGKRGLPAEYGIAWLLPRIIGAGRALELLLSSRVFSAEEAASMGLVTRVAEDVVDAAVSYARDIVRDCAATSLALMRHQVYAGLSSDYETALDGSYRAMALMVGHEAFAEGVRSFLERTPPQFAGLDPDFAPAQLTGIPDVGLDYRPESLELD